jgi:hypothetical protein
LYATKKEALDPSTSSGQGPYTLRKLLLMSEKILKGLRFKVYGSDYHIKKRQNFPEKNMDLFNGNFCWMDSLNHGMN